MPHDGRKQLVMRVFIDADACPVKNEALKVAERYDLPVFIVSNGGMRPSRDPRITCITVPKTPDAADDWIADHISENDVVVTQDIPLAARTLEINAHALGPGGRVFDDNTIGMALAVREVNQMHREANQTQTRHSAFTAKDRSNFLQAFDRIVVANKR